MTNIVGAHRVRPMDGPGRRVLGRRGRPLQDCPVGYTDPIDGFCRGARRAPNGHLPIVWFVSIYE